MLTEQERREIEEEIPRYPSRSAVGPEALKIVQKHRGWVTDQGLLDVAELLRMAPAELESIATFYNLLFRKPVGRHVILICNSVTCWIMGYESLRALLAERLGIDLGETTADGRFTLLPIPCLGACDHAPALMIDNDLHTDVTSGKIDQLLERYP